MNETITNTEELIEKLKTIKEYVDLLDKVSDKYIEKYGHSDTFAAMETARWAGAYRIQEYLLGDEKPIKHAIEDLKSELITE